MIKNERQYRASQAQADLFTSALARNDELELIRSGVAPEIAAAHKTALRGQLDELQASLKRYDDLRSGRADELKRTAVAELGALLIEARIARGLSHRGLADRLGLKEQQVQRYEQDGYASADLERLAEVANALDLHVAISARLGVSPTLGRETSRFDASRLPIKLMEKRGWLSDFRGAEKIADGPAPGLAAAFMRRYGSEHGLKTLHKRTIRTRKAHDEDALAAWEARVRFVATRQARELQLPTYNEPLDADFVRRLVKLSREPDGPALAVKLLREHGVAVVVEAHLPGTHLDGAAMALRDGRPVIALTLRHDRLDNFWFTVLHEVAHIVRHRDQLSAGFFDSSEEQSDDPSEIEADEYAAEALIPRALWQSSFVRMTRSESEISKFASTHGVGDAVVAGRIRRERGYKLFDDLVGRGAVSNSLRGER